MEFLRITLEISKELLRFFGLNIVLLFLFNDVFEFDIAGSTVSWTCIRFYALVMVGVTTHEMDGWQRKSFITSWTFLLIEVFCLRFKIVNLSSHCFNFLHVLVHCLVVFSNNSILSLKSVQKIFLDDFEFQIWLALENFENKKRTEDLFFRFIFISLTADD
jgi:hypothetical protein